MEVAGLCERRVDPQDRRSSLIELTSSGQQMLTLATETFEEELKKLIGSSTSLEKLHEFDDLIRQLRKGLGPR
jgi:DNA-binding MarR family transcriptional regulator